jgi:hypothetical protein
VVYILLIFVFAFFVWLDPVCFHGAPFSPTAPQVARDAAVEIVRIKPAALIAELGCGNGNVVLKFAQLGACVDGYEINGFLVKWARWRIVRQGLSHKAAVLQMDFWHVNLRPYNVVFVFQVGFIMSRLERKLRTELLPGSYVVSNCWEAPGLPLMQKRGTLWIYRL